MDSDEASEPQRDPSSGNVELREVAGSDLELFLVHQLDDEASRLIGFASRSKAELDAHWAKVLALEKCGFVVAGDD